MKNEINAEGKFLVVNGCEPIEFEEEIERTLDMDTVVVVLTIPQRGYMTDNRIYGIRDGKIAWQVQDMLEYIRIMRPLCRIHIPILRSMIKTPALCWLHQERASAS